jgi:hypothetical protein
LGERLAHAGELGALTREEKCGLHAIITILARRAIVEV